MTPRHDVGQLSSEPEAVLRPQPRERRSERTRVHPTALVDPAATIGPGSDIGPGAIVGPDVRLGPRARVGARAILTGDLVIEEDARIWPGAILGEDPQDLDFDVETRSGVRIGPRCQIREYATVHRATVARGMTVIGADVLLMSSSHVAHDCRVADHAILCNGALLAGHVQMGRRAFVSGNSVVHQFVRIGELAMIGGGSRVARDVPPFALLVGNSLVRGINGVGLRRAQFPRASQVELRELYRILYRSGLSLEQALPRLRETAVSDEGRRLVAFVEVRSKRGYCYGIDSSASHAD